MQFSPPFAGECRHKICSCSGIFMNTLSKNASPIFSVVLGVMILLMAAGSRAQNLFVSSDVNSGYITEIEPGIATNIFSTGFNYPMAIAFDSEGDLFVLNNGSGNIIEVKPGGTQIPFAAGLSNPQGMAMDNSNNLFVADGGNSRVEEFTPNGTPLTVVSNVPLGCVALDSAGNLYVGDYMNNDVLEFTNMNGAYGTNSYVFASLPYTPLAMAFNSAGDLFVDYYSGYAGGGIAEITPGGMQNTFAEFGMPWPVTMVFDSAGNLYVSDLNAGTVSEYTPGGVESTNAAGLIEPCGLAFQPPPVTPPTLGIAPAGNQAVLFWPATNGNFLLQSATNMNGTNWTTVSNSVPILGFRVTNAPGSRFFRLERQ